MSDWSNWTAAAFRGASLGVDEWRLDAEFAGVTIIGGFATAGPGTLRSPVVFAATIRSVMAKAKAPAVVADAVSAAIWDAWKRWADGVTIPSLPWYPAFFAWPSPVAPPIPNVPMPLALCFSTGLDAMSPARLAKAINDRIGATPVPDAAAGVDDLARSFSHSFMTWTASAMVTMALGTGSAPVGPLNPVMPVAGTLLNNGRGCLAAAVPFPDAPPSRQT